MDGVEGDLGLGRLFNAHFIQITLTTIFPLANGEAAAGEMEMEGLALVGEG